MTCSIKHCRKESTFRYYGYKVCQHHWDKHCDGNDKFNLKKEFNIKPDLTFATEYEAEFIDERDLRGKHIDSAVIKQENHMEGKVEVVVIQKVKITEKVKENYEEFV